MNNLLSYCGLVDARISASEKDLPVSTLYARTKVYLEASLDVSDNFDKSHHVLASLIDFGQAGI